MWSRSFEAIDLQKTSAACALEPLWYVHKRRPIVSVTKRDFLQREVSSVASNRAFR